jgi:hypothetical protein
MDKYSSMINDSITCILCMMDNSSHPFNHSIPTPMNQTSFYMDSVSYPYTMRTHFECHKLQNDDIPVFHGEVLKTYLHMLIRARMNYNELETYNQSIEYKGYLYHIAITLI